MTTRTPRKRTFLTALLGALALVAGLGLAGASTASAEPIANPPVVPTSSNPPAGSIMPHFPSEQLQLRSGAGANDTPYTITIDSAPTSASPGQPLTITGHTTGFSPGNWVNAWVKLPNGVQFDDGGIITNGNTFTIPMTLMYPGQNTIQLSAGTWPAEQWTAPMNITVGTAPQLGPYGGTAVGVTYHDLQGHTVVVAEAVVQPWAGWTPMFDILKNSNPYGHDDAPAQQIAPNVYIGFDTPVSSSGLAQLPPNSSDFHTGVAFVNNG